MNPSSCIRQNKDYVLQRWIKRAREVVPAASALPKDEDLLNSLPQFVDKLADLIHSVAEFGSNERCPKELVDTCRDHGAQRSRVDLYTLDQVILRASSPKTGDHGSSS